MGHPPLTPERHVSRVSSVFGNLLILIAVISLSACGSGGGGVIEI